MKKIRLGVIGAGGMGSSHARAVLNGRAPRVELAAVCDLNAKLLENYPDEVARYTDSDEMLKSDAFDAVIVATPHYFHTTVGIAVLQAGKHLLVEKPISVHKADAERLIAAHTDKNLVFSTMFCRRNDPAFRKIHQMVHSGEIGEIIRVTWLVTNWFRSQSYYDQGGWRATWKGEGGGVLLNQCPHNLDLLQWICGMPTKVHAYCHIAKHHDIEVEDDVSAYMEFANGATGVFITSTGEAPGVNRLEISGDRGLLSVEDGEITFYRNEIAAKEFIGNAPSPLAKPPVWKIKVPPLPNIEGVNIEIIRNFADAILDGAPLIAPGEEGINSLELGNAMLLSSMSNRAIDLPMDSAEYERLMQKLIAQSKS